MYVCIKWEKYEFEGLYHMRALFFSPKNHVKKRLQAPFPFCSAEKTNQKISRFSFYPSDDRNEPGPYFLNLC